MPRTHRQVNPYVTPTSSTRRILRSGIQHAGSAASHLAGRVIGNAARRILEATASNNSRIASSSAGSRSTAPARRHGVSVQALGAVAPRSVKVKTSKKSIRVPGKKKIKVSKSLRQKIGKVLEDKKMNGYFQATQVEVGFQPGSTNGGQQAQGVPALQDVGLFHPALILHAASRLWNSKAKPGTFTYALGDAGNLDTKAIQIEVQRQWWTHRLKNNSQRVMFITIYKCQPRGTKVSKTPANAWIDGLAQTGTIGTNVANIGFSVLYTTPQLSPEFNNSYKTETLKFTMDPGQSVEFNVQGPRMVYDFQKFYTSGVADPKFSFDCLMLAVGHIDTVVGALNTGHAAQSNVSEKLIWESTYHCKLSIPETVGLKALAAYPAPGVMMNLTERQHRFCIDDYSPTGAYGAYVEINEDNPASIIV